MSSKLIKLRTIERRAQVTMQESPQMLKLNTMGKSFQSIHLCIPILNGSISISRFYMQLIQQWTTTEQHKQQIGEGPHCQGHEQARQLNSNAFLKSPSKDTTSWRKPGKEDVKQRCTMDDEQCSCCQTRWNQSTDNDNNNWQNTKKHYDATSSHTIKTNTSFMTHTRYITIIISNKKARAGSRKRKKMIMITEKTTNGIGCQPRRTWNRSWWKEQMPVMMEWYATHITSPE